MSQHLEGSRFARWQVYRMAASGSREPSSALGEVVVCPPIEAVCLILLENVRKRSRCSRPLHTHLHQRFIGSDEQARSTSSRPSFSIGPQSRIANNSCRSRSYLFVSGCSGPRTFCAPSAARWANALASWVLPSARKQLARSKHVSKVSG